MFTTDFYSAVSSIVTVPLSFLYAAILTLEWRFSARTTRVLISAFLVLLSAGAAAYFFVCGISKDTKLYFAVFETVVIIVFYLSISKYPLLSIMSTGTTAWLFALISDAVCGIFVPQAGFAHVLMKLVSFSCGALLLVCFFRRPLLKVQREIQRGKWLWMMIFPLVMCVVFFGVVQMQGPVYMNSAFKPVVLALCFYALSVYTFFHFVLRSLQKQYQMQSETAVLKVHLSSLKKHAETMRAMSDEINLLKHDLRHYIHMQSVCLENGDMDGMREALDSLSQHVTGAQGSHFLRQYTGQPLIDAVLSYYADCAETEGIDFQVKLYLPKELEDTSELAVLLSNALENACNACLKMDAHEKREIRLTGGVESRQFLLEVINTYCGTVQFDKNGRPAAQRAGHGYGTQSIVSFAEKHHALLYYRAKDGWFQLRFLMELK